MVKFVTAIVLAMIAVATYEYFFGWPEWLTVNEHRGRIPRGF